MDVRCTRCETEYELDDALVSDRGTMVKCTNCGLQFRVQPPKGKGASSERWVVRKADGSEVNFSTLAELQKAIAARQVSADDLLSRDNQPFRALGAIVELQPFLRAAQRPVEAAQAAPAPPKGIAPRTLIGINPDLARAAAASPSVAPSPTGTPSPEPSPADPSATPAAPFSPSPSSRPPRPQGRTLPGQPAPAAHQPDAMADTLPRPEQAELPEFLGGWPSIPGSAQASRSRAHSLDVTPVGPVGAIAHEDELPTRPMASPEDELPTQPLSAPPARAFSAPPAGAMNAPSAAAMPLGRREVSIAPPYQSQPGSEVPSASVIVRGQAPKPSGAYPSNEDLEPDLGRAVPRAARLRWVVALVLLGVVGLAAGTVGRRYLDRAKPPEPAAHSDASERVSSMIQKGEQLFYQGDLEGAKAEFDKVTALSERDAIALSFLARLESVRADITWLKLRLLPAGESAERASTEQELSTRSAKLDAAIALAKAAAADHTSVVRAELDALRIAGKQTEARALAPKLSTAAAEPETDYVLGALDLADPSPTWSTVIERLRTASAVERGLGRARAALVYALVNAKRVSEAKVELEKLALEPSVHPLLPLLKAYVGDQGKTDEQSDQKDEPPAQEPADEEASPKGGAKGAAAPGEAPTSDPRVLLKRAGAARRSGNTEQAEQLYHMVLAESPGNYEAFTALGEIALQKGDYASATRYFDSVLQANPHYLPALVGLADIKWAQGQRAQAAELYQKVVDRTGTASAYGARAAARIAEIRKPTSGEAAPTPPAPPPPAEAPPAPPPPGPAPPSDTPHIDTSDLPGFEK